MAEKKRKYLLFTKSDGRADAQKPCAFFVSSAGCRNGAGCQFSHGDDHPTLATVAKVVEKEEKVEVKVKKAVKKVEPAPAPIPEPIKVVKTVKANVQEVQEVKKPKVIKKEITKDSIVATVPPSVPNERTTVLQALEAQKKQFELQMKKQEEMFLQQQKKLQLQMQEQSNTAEKIRQQEQFQIDEDQRLLQLAARQAAHQLATGQTAQKEKEERRRQTQLQNKRRKSNDSQVLPIPLQQKQQQKQQPQQPTQQSSVINFHFLQVLAFISPLDKL